MVTGVQNFVGNLRTFQSVRDLFGFFDRHGADEDRLAALDAVLDQLVDRVVFLAQGPIDLIVLVVAHHRIVGRHVDHFELVNFREFGGFGHRRAGHARKFRVQAEIVLEGDRGQRLVLVLDLRVFFRLERLMQPFGEAPAFHHPTSEFIDDDHLVVFDDVVAVALE